MNKPSVDNRRDDERSAGGPVQSGDSSKGNKRIGDTADASHEGCPNSRQNNRTPNCSDCRWYKSPLAGCGRKRACGHFDLEDYA